MATKIVAIILAAGLSRRMGSPKMLLPWGNTTVLGQVVATYSQAGVDEIAIVTGGSRQAVEFEARRLSQEFKLNYVFNPHYATGEMLSSLQCGLASLAYQIDSVLIGLGDQPQLGLAAVQAVISGGKSVTNKIIVPSFNFKRGHPWLVPREFWPAIATLQPPQTLRDFLNAHAGDIIYIEADHTILKDLDTPEEYQSDKP